MWGPSYICPSLRNEYNSFQSEEAQPLPLKIALARTTFNPQARRSTCTKELHLPCYLAGADLPISEGTCDK
jgi:hypothetical protein